jgi:hypothetical protein
VLTRPTDTLGTIFSLSSSCQFTFPSRHQWFVPSILIDAITKIVDLYLRKRLSAAFALSWAVLEIFAPYGKDVLPTCISLNKVHFSGLLSKRKVENLDAAYRKYVCFLGAIISRSWDIRFNGFSLIYFPKVTHTHKNISFSPPRNPKCNFFFLLSG